MMMMMNGNSSFLVCFSLGTFFLLLLNHASAENQTEPRKNVNLSPFESIRSAYFCMMNNTSPYCLNKVGFHLTIDGVLDVKDTEIKEFCNYCQQYTDSVLQCIKDVKRDFKFATNQNVSYVGNATDAACTQQKGFNTNVTNPNSATSLYGRLSMPLFSTLTTMAFIATFGV